jgi:hypothetical protein
MLSASTTVREPIFRAMRCPARISSNVLVRPAPDAEHAARVFHRHKQSDVLGER